MFTIFSPSYLNNNLLKERERERERETQRISHYKPKEAYGPRLSLFFPLLLENPTGKVHREMGYSAQRDKVTKPI